LLKRLRWRGGVHADRTQQHSRKQTNQNTGSAVEHRDCFQEVAILLQAQFF